MMPEPMLHRGTEIFNEGTQHTFLLQQSATSNSAYEFSLRDFDHAEDQLMQAETFRVIAEILSTCTRSSKVGVSFWPDSL